MMMTLRKGIALTAVALALPLAAISTGNAMPATSALALSTPMANAANADHNVTQVRWRGRGHYRGGHYHGGGAGLGLGLAAGALLGGAIAAGSSPYYYGPGYGYAPGYAPGYAVAPSYDADADAYCRQRYRSYDPASGTYLNYDGNRYPCP